MDIILAVAAVVVIGLIIWGVLGGESDPALRHENEASDFPTWRAHVEGMQRYIRHYEGKTASYEIAERGLLGQIAKMPADEQAEWYALREKGG